MRKPDTGVVKPIQDWGPTKIVAALAHTVAMEHTPLGKCIVAGLALSPATA
ncbi:hypothetical protein [Streptomyces sp. NPDC048508]|uniref:hypothetical protein n=1 Tax=Streptomyces sp. NPDC048508 TaxID=3365561 RepID=UPI003715757C